jgi:hypothetical protein
MNNENSCTDKLGSPEESTSKKQIIQYVIVIHVSLFLIVLPIIATDEVINATNDEGIIVYSLIIVYNFLNLI